MSAYFVHRADCAQRNLVPGVDIATMAGDRLMISVVRFEPGAEVPVHDHPHEQVGMLLEGQLDFYIGEQRELLGPGDMWRIPGGVPHRVIAGPEGARALDVFHPVREDYL